MPLTATMEDIKSYQEKVDKNEITPFNLPACPDCYFDSQYFKIHSYRERCFLIIIKMYVRLIYCTLVRFRCPRCGKTITNYPDFAIPYKRYTRQTIESYSSSYVEDDQKTYESAVMTDNGSVEYRDTCRELAPSTIHRWISTLANLIIFYQEALPTPLQKKIFPHLWENLASITIPKKKYKTDQRKVCLLRCCIFFRLKRFFKNHFTEFAIKICLT